MNVYQVLKFEQKNTILIADASYGYHVPHVSYHEQNLITNTSKKTDIPQKTLACNLK